MNPLMAADPYSQDVLSQLYLPLVEVGGPGEDPILPALAASWSRGEDGLSVAFTLQEGLSWSDGEPITAEDVRFSFEAHTHPGIRWPGAAFKGAITQVEAADDLTVIFRFERPDPEDVLSAGSGPILPAHAWSRIPFEDWPTHDFNRKPVTGGPFLIHKRGEATLTLRPNPAWPELLRPLLGQVTFRALGSEAAILDAALAAQVDFIAGVPPARLSELRAAGQWRFQGADDFTTDFVAWNTARPPFDSAQMRQAMTLAIDRDALVARVLAGFGRVGGGLISPQQWAFDASVPRWPLDRERALEDLAELGWTDSDGDGWLDKGGARLSFALFSNEESPLRGTYAAQIRDQLREVGIHVVVRTLPMAQLGRLLISHDFDAVVSTWRGSPRVDLSMFHSAAAQGGHNYGAFGDPELDTLLEEAPTAPRERAAELWSRAQVILHEAQPYTVLAERQRVDALRRDLRGIRPSPSPLRDLAHWWVAPVPPQPVEAGGPLEGAEGASDQGRDDPAEDAGEVPAEAGAGEEGAEEEGDPGDPLEGSPPGAGPASPAGDPPASQTPPPSPR